ncbi:MAG: Ig-like domain-containing protein, partial [Clostridia bacterium]|nr:Ig-like domain-containing protein [Clostridia bacterium]
MKACWRTPPLLITALAAAMLVCFSGLASAAVTSVEILSPTNGAPFINVQPGDTVTVRARVTVDATDQIWMNATVGNSTVAFTNVGLVTVPGGNPSASGEFDVALQLRTDETDGSKNVSVSAYAQNNPITMTDTETGAVTVDGTAPTIANWTPADASFENITQQTFTVDVSDAGSGVDWAGITFASVQVTGGTLDNVTANSGTGKVTIAIRGMNTPGAKSVRLEAADVAGNIATSTHNFELNDTIKPTFSSWSITEGQWLNTGSPTLTVNIADSLPTAGIATVTATIDGSPVGVAFDSGTGVATAALSGLAEGSHALVVTATDGSGNSESSTRNFNVDTTKPVIDGNTWSPASGYWFKETSASITVNAADPGSGGAPATGSGINAASATASLDKPGPTAIASYAGGKITVNITNLSEDTYVLTVGISDAVGNAADPRTMTFNVDFGGPEFANQFPVNGFETNNTAIAPHIEITDTQSSVDSSSIKWNMTAPGGGAVVGGYGWAAPTSTYTPASPLAGDGTYTLSVTARNGAGLASTYPISPAAWAFLLDTVAPPDAVGTLVNDSGQAPRDVRGEQFTRDTSPAIDITVLDNAGGSGFNNESGSGTSSIVIRVYTDAGMTDEVAGSITPAGRPATDSESWGARWTASAVLSDGDYFYKVIATDDAGSTGTITNPSFKFIIDTKAPTADGEAEVGFVNTTNTRRFANNPAVTAAWAASVDPAAADGAAGAGLLGYKLEIWTKTATDMGPTGAKVHEASGVLDVWLSDSFLAPSGAGNEQYTSGVLALTSGTSYGAWIKSFDFLGNASNWFDPPFVYDSDAPADPGVPGVVGISAGGQIASSAPTFRWAHASDAKAGVAQSGVDLYEFQIRRVTGSEWDVFDTVIDIADEDVDLAGADTPLAGDFDWTILAPFSLADGNYQARVRAKDVAGNYSNWVESAQFEVDTTPPAIPAMPQTTSPTNNQSPVWTWGAVAGAAKYRVFEDEADKGFVTNPTYTSASLTEGTHYLQVTALDDLD